MKLQIRIVSLIARANQDTSDSSDCQLIYIIETTGREEWEAESSEEDQGLGWLLGLRNPITRVTNIMKKCLSKMWTRRKVPGMAQPRNVDHAYRERVE